jgi:hypothetical protein
MTRKIALGIILFVITAILISMIINIASTPLTVSAYSGNITETINPYPAPVTVTPINPYPAPVTATLSSPQPTAIIPTQKSTIPHFFTSTPTSDVIKLPDPGTGGVTALHLSIPEYKPTIEPTRVSRLSAYAVHKCITTETNLSRFLNWFRNMFTFSPAITTILCK